MTCNGSQGVVPLRFVGLRVTEAAHNLMTSTPLSVAFEL